MKQFMRFSSRGITIRCRRDGPDGPRPEPKRWAWCGRVIQKTISEQSWIILGMELPSKAYILLHSETYQSIFPAFPRTAASAAKCSFPSNVRI